ncbi:hypothetical protein KIPB_010836, partial [Kipferlia bialata]
AKKAKKGTHTPTAPQSTLVIRQHGARLLTLLSGCAAGPTPHGPQVPERERESGERALRMFVAAGGLQLLVRFICLHSPIEEHALFAPALACINALFHIKTGVPTNDFCRLLASNGVPAHLASALLTSVLSLGEAPASFTEAKEKPKAVPGGDDDSDSDWGASDAEAGGEREAEAQGMWADEVDANDEYLRVRDVILSLCTLLSVFARADVVVRLDLSDPACMAPLLKALSVLTERPDMKTALLVLLSLVKNLAMDPECRKRLMGDREREREEGAKTGPSIVAVLVPLLAFESSVRSPALSALYNICRLDRHSQEQAVEAGIVPLLHTICTSNDVLRQFAIPLVLNLTRASNKTRDALWRNNGVRLVLSFLALPIWTCAALEALS